jgi:hypothetical protein
MYKLFYDQITGKVASIIRLSDNASIPLDERNMDFQAFLKWNSAQAVPLDLKSTIEPIKPAPVRDLAAEVDLLKSKVTTLEAKVK